MDFTLTDEQQAIRELFQSFATKEIRPVAAELDTEPRFPGELFARAGELGFFAMRYPEPEGAGLDVQSFLIATEELAYGSLAVAACCTMQALMGSHFVQAFCTGDVRDRLVPAALAGEVRGTICIY